MKESQFGMNTVEEILAEGGTAFSPPKQRRPKMAYEHEEGKVSLFKNDKAITRSAQTILVSVWLKAKCFT